MALALMPLCLAACSDDDDATGVGDVETLYGTWQQTSGYAIEDGEKHHEKSVGKDEAEFLWFDDDGSCKVRGGDRGVCGLAEGEVRSYRYDFDQEEEQLTIGGTTYYVEVLSSGTLRLRRSYGSDSEVAVYKKASNDVWADF